MRILWNDKDGGPESRVWCWGLEVKSLGSVLVLLFKEGSREAFHSHAFNALSWVLRGGLKETFMRGSSRFYFPSLRPVVTMRTTTHKVYGLWPRNWVLSIRGPWSRTWSEYSDRGALQLTHGRVAASSAI